MNNNSPLQKRTLLRWSTLTAAVTAIAGLLGYPVLAAHRVSLEANRLAEVLALGSTSRVGDVGAGDGAFSLELASRIVPRGHVFATEIADDALAGIRAKVSAAGIDNITVIRAADASSNLPRGCCDALFLRGVYHHLTKPAEMNQSLRDALLPAGRLAVIDFKPSRFFSLFFPVRGVPPNRGGHGVSPDVVVREVEGAGMRLLERFDAWPNGQYCLVFQKPPLEPVDAR